MNKFENKKYSFTEKNNSDKENENHSNTIPIENKVDQNTESTTKLSAYKPYLDMSVIQKDDTGFCSILSNTSNDDLVLRKNVVSGSLDGGIKDRVLSKIGYDDNKE